MGGGGSANTHVAISQPINSFTDFAHLEIFHDAVMYVC